MAADRKMTATLYPLGEKSPAIKFLFACRWMRYHPMISTPVSVIIAVSGIVLQWILFGDYQGAPFLTLYPAVVISTLWSGFPLGVVVCLIGGASQWLLFIPYTHSPAIATYAFDAAVCTLLCDFVNRSFDRLLEIIDHEKRSGRQHYMVARELHHRIQNMFAVIVAVIRFSTPRNAIQKSVLDRLNSMAQTNVMISESDINGVALRKLLEPEIAISGGRIRATCTDGVMIGAQLAQNLSLILHELVTNAIKYGSLSVSTGMVVLNIQVEGDHLALRWHEHGGPKVTKPEGEGGFGTRLLDRFANGLGRAFIHYDSKGLMYSFKINSDDIWFADNVITLPTKAAA